jgi:CNT family concentrative nucleoside transporter
MFERFMSLVGLFCMVGVAYLLSSHKKKINWPMVIKGVGIQIVFALLILKTTYGMEVFEGARSFFNSLLAYTTEGSKFIFGELVNDNRFGFIFVTMVLPTIIFMSSLMSVLYHLGLAQHLIKAVAIVMVKVLGTSGAESLSAAANIFVGQTEAPLVIRPYIDKMTRSEIMTLMTGGMATVAGGVFAAYVGMGINAGHLLAASVMSAPAALIIGKILVPETEVSSTYGEVKMKIEKTTVNIIDAAAMGAGEGLKLSLNVAGMLLAFIALIALLNGVLSLVGGWFGFEQLSLELITGYLFAPFAFLLGIPTQDIMAVGTLLGKKVIINEFVAYLDMQSMKEALSERSVIISTYALCGFANFSSIAIQIGGIGTLAPGRRSELAELGIKSLIGGTLACFMTASIAGILL